jgi:hypothetical protein
MIYKTLHRHTPESIILYVKSKLMNEGLPEPQSYYGYFGGSVASLFIPKHYHSEDMDQYGFLSLYKEMKLQRKVSYTAWSLRSDLVLYMQRIVDAFKIERIRRERNFREYIEQELSSYLIRIAND